MEAGPCSYLAGEPPGQAPPLVKPHPGTVPRASLMAPSPPGDLGFPCLGRVPGGARLPPELAPAAMPSPLPSGARDLWGLEHPAPPSWSPDLLGLPLQRLARAVISPSRPGCERPGDRGGLTLLAPLPSPLHPWGKPLRNRDSPAWLKTREKLDSGPFSRHCPVCIPCGSKRSRSFGQRRVIHAPSHPSPQRGSCGTYSPSGLSRMRVLPSWMDPEWDPSSPGEAWQQGSFEALCPLSGLRPESAGRPSPAPEVSW